MAVTQSNGLNRGVTDPAINAGNVDSDVIRRDIDQTRCEMDRTIDELGERLKPRNLFDELVASVKGQLFSGMGASCPPGTSGSTGMTSAQMSQQVSHLASGMGRSFVEAVRENPVPAALMGAGLAWLLFEDKAERAYRRRRIESHVRGYTGDPFTDPHTHSGSYVDARTGKPYDESYGAGYADLDYDGEPDVCPPSMKDKVSGAASSVKDTLSSAAHAVGSAASAVGSAASRAAQGVRSAASTTGHAASAAGRRVRSGGRRAGELGRSTAQRARLAGETAREYRERTGESLREFGQSTAESMRQYRRVAADKTRYGYEVSAERFNDALEDKPLAVGVAALAAGLLAGFAMPRTRMEDRTIGRTSDQLKEEAKRRSREAVEQGREVVSHVASEALGEAEGQGLTPGSLGDKVARVAKDALSAAQEAARREGVDPATLAEKARQVGQTVKERGKDEIRQHARSGATGGQSESFASSGSTGTLGLTDTGMNAGAACGIGSTGTAGSLSDFSGGSTSNFGGDMSSVKDDADTKHDIAEGMSASSQGKSKAKGKAKKDTGDSCGC